ncbi:MAG: hypothetical protein MJ069_05275 [Salinivirgaceae bacterium]|nr:hypothetical protein [Salinivirgaceae bacterium]
MKKIKSILAFCFILLIANNIQAQTDTVLLMKGKRLLVNNSQVQVNTKGDTLVSFVNNKGRNKTKRSDKVFSVVNQSGKHVFFSDSDSIYGVNTEQFERYLNGKADYYHYKMRWGSFALGAATMAGGLLVPPINIDMGNSCASVYLGILIPYADFVLVSNSSVSKEKIIEQYNVPNDPYYISGVQAAISRHRIISNVLGMVVGVVPFVFLSATND